MTSFQKQNFVQTLTTTRNPPALHTFAMSGLRNLRERDTYPTGLTAVASFKHRTYTQSYEI